MTNIALLLRTLEHVETSDDYSQGCWRHCFAGTALKLVGYHVFGRLCIDKRAPQRGLLITERAARHELGIGLGRAQWMFSQSVDLHTLTELVQRCIDEARGLPTVDCPAPEHDKPHQIVGDASDHSPAHRTV